VIGRTALAALVAWAVVTATMPAVIRLCRKWEILDLAGPLKAHCDPTPRFGGVAIALGAAGALLICAHCERQLAPALAALGIVWATGLVDDWRGLHPLTRLILQFLAGYIAWAGSFRTTFSVNTIIDCLACCFVIVLFTNAFNLLDGSDGLAAGVAAILLLFNGALLALSRPTNMGAVTLSFSFAGAAGAFLPYNFGSLKSFLGDSGSYLLGFAVAYSALMFFQSHRSSETNFLVPLIGAELPLLDLAWAVIRRSRARRSALFGDRSHTYDLLVRRGSSMRRIALAYYVAATGLASAACLAWKIGPAAVVLLAIVSSLGLTYIAYRLGVLRVEEPVAGSGDRAVAEGLKLGDVQKIAG
jgi:UDP-GlcNAc:undecaprenyl-phosphate/decaprenyl-phosphate GlcNAc-1-phosphate transferase